MSIILQSNDILTFFVNASKIILNLEVRLRALFFFKTYAATRFKTAFVPEVIAAADTIYQAAADTYCGVGGSHKIGNGDKPGLGRGAGGASRRLQRVAGRRLRRG